MKYLASARQHTKCEKRKHTHTHASHESALHFCIVSFPSFGRFFRVLPDLLTSQSEREREGGRGRERDVQLCPSGALGGARPRLHLVENHGKLAKVRPVRQGGDQVRLLAQNLNLPLQDEVPSKRKTTHQVRETQTHTHTRIA